MPITPAAMTGKKRRIPTTTPTTASVDGSSSSSSSVLTFSSAVASSSNPGVDGNSHDRGVSRHRLQPQRVSKDKVYAERLQAAGNDNLDNKLDISIAVSNGNVMTRGRSGGDDSPSDGGEASNVEKGKGLASSTSCNDRRQSRTCNSTSKTGGSASKTKQSSETSSTKRRRSRKGDDGVERIISPPCWPFSSDPSATSRSYRNRKSHRTTQQYLGSKSEDSTNGENIFRSEETSNSNKQDHLPSLKESRDGFIADIITESVIDGSVNDYAIVDSIELAANAYKYLNEDQKSYSSQAKKRKCVEQQSPSVKQLATQHSPNTACLVETIDNSLTATSTSDWSCNQCTLRNTNRRKKCQACGIPRHLTMDIDGTLMLNEFRHGNDCDVGIGKDIYDDIDDGDKEQEPSFDSGNDLDCHSQQLSQKEKDAELQQQSQQLMIAMIDAPVYTRSRRRGQLSQTTQQSSTTTDDGNGEGRQRSSSQQPLLQQQEVQQEQGDISELRQWIQRRRDAKAETRRRLKSMKSLPSASTSQLEKKAVKVQITVGREYLMLSGKSFDYSACSTNPLMAFVPTAVLVRINKRSDDTSISHVTKEAFVGGKDHEQVDLDDLAHNSTSQKVSSVVDTSGKDDNVAALDAVHESLHVQAALSEEPEIDTKLPILFSKSSLPGTLIQDSCIPFAQACGEETTKPQLSAGTIRCHKEYDAPSANNFRLDSAGVEEHGSWTTQTNARKLDLPFIPMTQVPSFDYFSQASIGSSQLSPLPPLTRDSNTILSKQSVTASSVARVSDKCNIMVELSNQNDATLDGFQYHLGSQEETNSTSLDPDHASDDHNDTDFVVEAYDGLGFRTGGNGIAIEVSEEQIAKATKILDLKTEDDVPYNYEESLWDTSNVDVERSPFIGFQTGGSGTTIAISDEQLVKATQIFGGMNDQEDVNWGYSESCYETTYVESLPSIVPCFRTGGSGKAIAISDEQLAVATTLLDMNHQHDLHIEEEVVRDGLNADTESRPPVIIGFQTGGSGKAIEVSDEQIAKATQLLGISQTEDIERSTESHLDKSENADDESRPPVIIGFQTGGSGKAIKVSSEQIVKATQLLGILPKEDIERSTESHVRNSDTSYRRRDKEAIQEANTDEKVDADHCNNFHDNMSSSYQNDSDKCLHGVQESSLNNRDVDLCEEDLSSSSDAIPIVTPAALASDDCNYRIREGASITSSPPERLHHNPLHEMTNFAHDPLLQSAMKSKRLFDSTVKARKNKCIDRSKVTLRELRGDATEMISWASCIEHGVKDVTLRVTSINAIKLRFNSNDNTPLFLLGQRDVPKCTNVGKVTDILDWLCCQGCDKTFVTEKWIQNHFRWIVWKLAAMERRFPEQLGGQYLNYGHVLSQIKGRYQKELCDAKRPAVRKVLNRDVSACLPIILCVGQILRFKPKSPQNAQHDQTIGKTGIDEIRLELSDGWYAVPAILDSVLSTLVGSGKICVGSKLMICNAQLVGSEDGVDPLDDDYFSDRRDCRIALHITANNTRLAVWDAKLGFVHPKFTSQQGGSLLVKTLSGIFPDGGTVPVIDLVLCKVYPRLYLEQLKDDKTVVTNHLTEAEEAARQNDKEINRQRESEQFVSDSGTEFSEDVDEAAPPEWKAMMTSNFPEEYYERLGDAEKKGINDWKERRSLLMQSMTSRSVVDSLNDQTICERTSLPYVRVLVKGFHHSRQKGRHARAEQKSADLTIWRVSDEQLNRLKEGTVLRMKNLGVKSGRDGRLQLKAKTDTPMEPLSIEPTQYELFQSGYEERHPSSLIRITLMSKTPEVSKCEVDVIACIIKIERMSENASAAYLTDESDLVMKVIRSHSSQNNDPFHLGNVEALPAVIALCNIEVTSFDTMELCAIGMWGITSCKTKNFMPLRFEEVQTWCNSAPGMEHCTAILDRINTGIPLCAGSFNRYRVCIGYILGVDDCQTDLDVVTYGFNVVIDYGKESPLTARLPYGIFLDALQLIESHSMTNAIGFTTASHFTLSEYFQTNQKMFRFSLEMSSFYGDELQLPSVTEISIADADSLSRMHLFHSLSSD